MFHLTAFLFFSTAEIGHEWHILRADLQRSRDRDFSYVWTGIGRKVDSVVSCVYFSRVLHLSAFLFFTRAEIGHERHIRADITRSRDRDFSYVCMGIGRKVNSVFVCVYFWRVFHLGVAD